MVVQKRGVKRVFESERAGTSVFFWCVGPGGGWGGLRGRGLKDVGNYKLCPFVHLEIWNIAIYYYFLITAVI